MYKLIFVNTLEHIQINRVRFYVFTIPRFIGKIVLSMNCYVHLVSPLLLSVDPGISVSAYMCEFCLK